MEKNEFIEIYGAIAELYNKVPQYVLLVSDDGFIVTPANLLEALESSLRALDKADKKVAAIMHHSGFEGLSDHSRRCINCGQYMTEKQHSFYEDDDCCCDPEDKEVDAETEEDKDQIEQTKDTKGE